MTESGNNLVAITNKDSRFYKLIGPFLGRREVHRAVGSAIWDDDDKTWLIVTNGRKVEGFLSYKGQRGVIAAESCYIARRGADGAEDQGVRAALVQKLIEVTNPSPIQVMVPRAVADTYTALGFSELESKSTKNYVSLVRGAQ